MASGNGGATLNLSTEAVAGLFLGTIAGEERDELVKRMVSIVLEKDEKTYGAGQASTLVRIIEDHIKAATAQEVSNWVETNREMIRTQVTSYMGEHLPGLMEEILTKLVERVSSDLARSRF